MGSQSYGAHTAERRVSSVPCRMTDARMLAVRNSGAERSGAGGGGGNPLAHATRTLLCGHPRREMARCSAEQRFVRIRGPSKQRSTMSDAHNKQRVARFMWKNNSGSERVCISIVISVLETRGGIAGSKRQVLRLYGLARAETERQAATEGVADGGAAARRGGAG